MDQIIRYFSRLSSRQVIWLSGVSLLIIAFLDFWAGTNVSTSIFYLIPVGIASAHSGIRLTLIFSFLSAFAWTTADHLSGLDYESNVIPLWNFIMRSGLFLVVGSLVHSLKEKAIFYEKLAEVDELTGLLNRRGFLTRLDEEMERARRFKRVFTIAYIDLDNFKQVNDTHGHKVGDKVLTLVAETLKTKLRLTDHIARMGGDEFTVLFVETGQQGARDAFEKCYQALTEKLLIEGLGVTVSAGVVTYTDFKSSMQQTIETADRWMYQVKKQGKNKVFYQLDTDKMPEQQK